MRQGAEWNPVGKLLVGFRFAGGVCAKLDCGSVTSVGQQKRKSRGTKWVIDHGCDESSPADCSVTLENSVDDVEIHCSGKLLHVYNMVINIQLKCIFK